jgi:hypothetical protein
MKARIGICVLLLMVDRAGADPQPATGDETKPLWEVGIFNFVSSIPDYRGADESTIYAFPLPIWSIGASTCGRPARAYAGSSTRADHSRPASPPPEIRQ